jgi:hypothetical protein
MARDRVTASLVALALVAITLAGCSGNKPVDMTCPKIIPAPGADTIALFGPGGHTVKDVMVGGKLYRLDAKCVREKVGIDVNTEIQFYAQRASLDIKDATFPYFVAIVGPDERVLTEEGFRIPIQFLPAEYDRRMPAEKITVHLPVKIQASGGAYTVIVGFQLTPDQLAFNRAAARAQ